MQSKRNESGLRVAIYLREILFRSSSYFVINIHKRISPPFSRTLQLRFIKTKCQIVYRLQQTIRICRINGILQTRSFFLLHSQTI